MGNEAEDNSMCETVSRDSVEAPERGFRSLLEETPIILPLLHATHPPTALDGRLHHSSLTAGRSHSFCPVSSNFDLSEILDGNCGHRDIEGDDRFGSLSSGRSPSVSFGDVTVCGRLGGDSIQHTVGVPLTPLPSLDDLPYIDDLILSAASPVLERTNSKIRRKSLASVIGAFPEWLANKSHFGSLSSPVSKSSLQDITEKSSLCRDAKGRQRFTSPLTQLHGSRLATGDHHPRVLQPAISLGAFGDWNDVENPTLMVSTVLSTRKIQCRREKNSLLVLFASFSSDFSFVLCPDGQIGKNSGVISRHLLEGTSVTPEDII